MDMNAVYITHRNSKKLLEVADVLRRRGVTVVHPKERPTTVLAVSGEEGKALASTIMSFFYNLGISHLAFPLHKPSVNAWEDNFYRVSREAFAQHPSASTFSLKRNSAQRILKALGVS